MADSEFGALAIVVLIIIGVVSQVIKKAMEHRPPPMRRPPPRPAEWMAPPAEPMGQPPFATPPMPPGPMPARNRQSVRPMPRRNVPLPAQPVRPVGAQPEVRIRLQKLTAKIEQEQRHLVNLQTQRQQLMQQLAESPMVPIPVEQVTTHSVVAHMDATPASAMPSHSGLVAPPALPSTSPVLTNFRQAILHYEIFAPPLSLRQESGQWDRM